jgi:hypothetical protein
VVLGELDDLEVVAVRIGERAEAARGPICDGRDPLDARTAELSFEGIEVIGVEVEGHSAGVPGSSR